MSQELSEEERLKLYLGRIFLAIILFIDTELSHSYLYLAFLRQMRVN